MDAINLALLDSADEIRLNAQTLKQNLAALQTEQPELAAALDETSLPPHWRPARTLDAGVSFRTDSPGTPRGWLGGSAAPNTRAAATLNLGRLTDKNVALVSVGAGAELTLLLRRLSTRQAVYVFERDLGVLAAILRLHDLSADIHVGRCILIPPNRERKFLTELLRTPNGLLPPGAIVAPPGVDADQLRDAQRVCESVAAAAAKSRKQRLETLHDARLSSQRPAGLPRLSVLALGAGAMSHRMAGALASAGQQLGWETCECVVAGPRDVHPLPHVAKLTTFDPSLTVCIDHDPAALPQLPDGVLCRWHLSALDVPETIEVSNIIHLAASPRIAELLRAAGAPSERVHEFHWGHAPFPYDQDSQTAQPTVILVGALPDARAEVCGVEQPTHKRLWNALRAKIVDQWGAATFSTPANLLRNVERECGVELADRDLRRRMLRIIEHVLVPAVVLERILHTLREKLPELRVVGEGWDRLAMDETMLAARSIEAMGRIAKPPGVSAAVFAGSVDPLTPDLPDAVALGWPVLMHSPDGASLNQPLGGWFQRQQHYEQFSGPKELLEQVRKLCDDPETARRRAERARTCLIDQHSYAKRLTTLAHDLGLIGTETKA